MSTYEEVKKKFISTLESLVIDGKVDPEALSYRLDYLANLARREAANDLRDRILYDPLQEEAIIDEYIREIIQPK